MSTDWMQSPQAARWLPVLHAAETLRGIPLNLLCRQCYEESHFNPDARSPAGAVGIMQLEPAYFPHAGANPINDISTAAAYLAQLHREFNDWQLALAAYDWGPGAVHRWVTDKEPADAMPAETRNYVAQICADVPVAGCLLPGARSVKNTDLHHVLSGSSFAVNLTILTTAAFEQFWHIATPPDVAGAMTAVYAVVCTLLYKRFFVSSPNGSG